MKRLASIAITTLILSASAVGVSSSVSASPKSMTVSERQTKCVQIMPGPFKRIGSKRCSRGYVKVR